MLFRRYMIAGLLLLMLMFSVPPAFAQAAEDIQLSDIIDAISPRTEDTELLLIDILLYIIFIVGLITSFLIPDKQMNASMLMFTVLALSVVAKLLIGDHASALLDPCDLPVLPINAAIFVLPLITAGMLRNVKGKPPKARWPSVIVGLAGGGYFFLFWSTQQSGDACEGAEMIRAFEYAYDVISTSGIM